MASSKMSIKEMREALDSKKISAVELAESYFDKINADDDKIGAFLTVTKDKALEEAKAAQQIIDSGKAGALCGIPIAIKDNISTEGVETTCASKMLKGYIPPYDATVIEHLKDAGAVMLGKTNMDEFAMGSSTQNSYYKKTSNPHDITKIPGGSSGGSAAAVAADMAPVSLGSDTGGSIRQPASFCGITGIKPTYGTVSRYGLVAFASSLDQIGVFGNSAEDCAEVLNVIAKKDSRDATSKESGIADFGGKIGADIKGLRIAVPTEFFGKGLDTEVRESVMSAASFYEKNGAELVPVSLPSLEYAIPAYYLISSSEASSNLARYDGVKYGFSADGESYDAMLRRTRSEGFGEEVKRRILLGSYALSSGYFDAYYKKGLLIRQKIKEEFSAIFNSCDIMLTPTTTSTALSKVEREDPVSMYLSDIYTVTINLAGLPGISLKCGEDSSGMPIGLQLISNHFKDDMIIGAADFLQKNR